MTPEEFPGPPPNIKSRRISLLAFDGTLFRTHDITRSPLYFGNSRLNRFDSPDDSYKVLYAGRDPFCAFIETLAKAAGTNVVTTTELKKKALAEIKATRPLRLIDLTQSGTLVRIGADSRLFSGAHGTAQWWSKALHDHPINADGLLYPSRLDPARHGIVVFQDRAPKMNELSRQSWYAPGPQRHLLAEIVDHYDIQVIESQVVVSRKPASRARQHGLFERE